MKIKVISSLGEKYEYQENSNKNLKILAKVKLKFEKMCKYSEYLFFGNVSVKKMTLDWKFLLEWQHTVKRRCAE